MANINLARSVLALLPPWQKSRLALSLLRRGVPDSGDCSAWPYAAPYDQGTHLLIDGGIVRRYHVVECQLIGEGVADEHIGILRVDPTPVLPTAVVFPFRQ